MMTKPSYREDWEIKQAWYEANGFVLGKNLFTTEDDSRGLASLLVVEIRGGKSP